MNYFTEILAPTKVGWLVVMLFSISAQGQWIDFPTKPDPNPPFTSTVNYDVFPVADTITGYTGTVAQVIIPRTTAFTPPNFYGFLNATVTAIGSNAFLGLTNITSVSIPETVTAIGNAAFVGCSNLTSVYFAGNAPTNLGIGIFPNPDTTVYYLGGTVGWDLTLAGNHAIPVNMATQKPLVTTFSTSLNSSAMVSSDHTQGVTVNLAGKAEVGYTNALTGQSITNDMIKNVLVQANSREWQPAFTTNNYADWTASVTLVNGSNYIQAYAVDAFGKTSMYSSNLVMDTVFNFVTNNGTITIVGAAASKFSTTRVNRYGIYVGSPIAFPSLQIPDRINGLPVTGIAPTIIGFNVTNQDGADHVPNYGIDSSAVAVAFGTNTSIIGDSAFSLCTNLESISIPATISTIGNKAFSDCARLTSVYFEGDAPAFVGTNVFGGDIMNIYFNSESTGWESVQSFKNIPMLQNPLKLGFPGSSGMFREIFIEETRRG